MYPFGVEREDWNRRWQERAPHVRDDPSDVLAAELGETPPGRALDLACGAGRNALWLAERGWQVTGVDFSDTALALARRAARERGVDVDWVQADVRSYRPEPAAYDLVVVLFLHLPPAQRRELLARAAAALAPGGRMLVLGHDVDNLGTGAPGPSDRSVLYAPETVARELDGLEVEKAERVVRQVEGEGGPVQAIDTLVVARRR